MPEPIRVQALLEQSVMQGPYFVHTTYGVDTQGASLEEARRSGLFVIGRHLGPYAMLDQDPPRPPQQLQSIDDVARHFAGFLPAGTHVVQDETVTQKSMGRLPELVIQFYRAERI